VVGPVLDAVVDEDALDVERPRCVVVQLGCCELGPILSIKIEKSAKRRRDQKLVDKSSSYWLKAARSKLLKTVVRSSSVPIWMMQGEQPDADEDEDGAVGAEDRVAAVDLYDADDPFLNSFFL